MSWVDRLEPQVVLTSPEGNSFVGSWVGDPRVMTKKVGIFEFPGLVGAVTQDLQVGASLDKLSFFFDGPDHDEAARRFWKACKERGAWSIAHPTEGRVTWQLLTVEQDIQPVMSGNITAFKTEWIEPITTQPEQSSAQASAAVFKQSRSLTSIANEQMEDTALVTKASDITKFKNAIRAKSDLIKTSLAPLTATVAAVNASVESVYRSVSDSLASAVFSVTSLAGQVQTMINLPSQIKGDVLTHLGYYGGLLQSALGISDAEQSNLSVNDAAVREVTAVTSIAAIANVVVTNPPTTRVEALAALTSIAESFALVVSSLDASQTVLGGSYVSQSSSFNDTSLLIAKVSDLLLKRSFDLATAKLVTLERHRTPVEIAMTEGVDIDQFIATNSLKGDDILLLPPGRVITVYL